jgi:diguanylate cyclase (GGDEF)-like protein
MMAARDVIQLYTAPKSDLVREDHLFSDDNRQIPRREDVVLSRDCLLDLSTWLTGGTITYKSTVEHKAILNKLQQKVYYKNLDSIYLMVNSSFARDFELEPEDLIGCTDFDLYPLDVAETFRREDHLVLTRGELLELDQVSGSKGSRSLKLPVKDEQGQVIGVLGIIWEDQGSIHSEPQIQTHDKDYHEIFDHSPISLWMLNLSKVKSLVEHLGGEGTGVAGVIRENGAEITKMLQNGGILGVNQSTLKLFEAKENEELIANLEEVFDADVLDEFAAGVEALLQGETTHENLMTWRTLNGRDVIGQVKWSVAPGHEQDLGQVLLSVVDVTGQKQADYHLQNNLAKTEALYNITRALSASILDLPAIFDVIVTHTAELMGDLCVLRLISEDHRELDPVAFHHCNRQTAPLVEAVLASAPKAIGNDAAGRVTKTCQPLWLPEVRRENIEEIIGSGYQEYVDQVGIHSLLVVPLMSAERVIGTLWVSRDRANEPYTQEDLFFLNSLCGQASLAIINARLHDLVKRQACIDSLTSLYNRRHFLELAEKEFSRTLRYERPMTIIMIDVDSFKKINDTYGHVIGDHVLQVVAERCRVCIRTTDILGRYGGDELSILLPETDLNGAHILAERVMNSITSAPVITECGDIPVTVSVGIARRTTDSRNLMAMLNEADEHMYAAKRAGRNQVMMTELIQS